VGLNSLYLSSVLADVANRGVSLLYLLTVAWFLYNLVDVADLWMRRWRRRATSRDSMMVALIRRALRVVLVLIFALVVAQNVFGLNITGFLASVGIIGLAVSLAAQDSIKNMFGSITVFFDQPFAVGDYIRFGDSQGRVEAIGFRSTKLRGDDGSAVTIPNMRFIDTNVQNISAQPSICRSADLVLAPATPGPQIERALALVRAVLERPALAAAFDLVQAPPRVYFDTVRPEGPVVKMIYWYPLRNGGDYWAFVQHAQAVNLALLDSLTQAGITFSLPPVPPPPGLPNHTAPPVPDPVPQPTPAPKP
jgi:MscS family membrane protein